MPKDFLCLADWTADELMMILDRARELKELLKRKKKDKGLPPFYRTAR